MSNEMLYRKLKFERKGNSNTYAASLSSETLVERYFGAERLIHTDEAVDLTRAKDGLPLLFNHNSDEPIGAVQDVRIDNGKLKGNLILNSNAKPMAISV